MESFNELDQQDKTAWLELFESQDNSAKEFCQQHELNYQQFLACKRNQAQGSNEFVEFTCDLGKPPSKQQTLAELELGNGMVFRLFAPNLSEAWF